MILVDKALLKAHVKKSGVVVKDYERQGAFSHHKQTPKPVPNAFHPRRDDNGDPVGIFSPDVPTDHLTWQAADKVTTFVPGGSLREPTSMRLVG